MTASAPPPRPAASPPPAGGEIVVYEAPSGEARVDVRFDGGTVRLAPHRMAEAFATAPENVLTHLRNVFASGALEEATTAEDFSVVRIEGSRRVRRRPKHYSLDAIVSVGYRIDSRRGVRFRQWTARALRAHLVRGDTVNERRLAERGLREARDTLDLPARALRNRSPVDAAAARPAESVA